MYCQMFFVVASLVSATYGKVVKKLDPPPPYLKLQIGSEICIVGAYLGYFYENTDKNLFLEPPFKIQASPDYLISKCLETCRQHPNCKSVTVDTRYSDCAFFSAGIVHGYGYVSDDGDSSAETDQFFPKQSANHYYISYCGDPVCGVHADLFISPLPNYLRHTTERAINHAWPWLALVVVTDEEDMRYCTAIIISKQDQYGQYRYLLTAASCVIKASTAHRQPEPVPKGNVTVYLGVDEFDIGSPKQEPRSVLTIRVHPNFALGRNGGEESDIAILMLNSSQEDNVTDIVRPICLRQTATRFTNDGNCKMVAFTHGLPSDRDIKYVMGKIFVVEGKLTEFNALSGSLAEIHMGFGQAMEQYESTPSLKTLARFGSGGMLACQRNVGGMSTMGGDWELHGIIGGHAHVTPSTNATFVPVLFHMQWIEDEITKAQIVDHLQWIKQKYPIISGASNRMISGQNDMEPFPEEIQRN